LCKLTYEWMSDVPDQVYGSDIGSRYQRQYLALGRQFKDDSRGRRQTAPSVAVQTPLPLEVVGRPLTDSLPLEISARD
jgi:hypothetical protein